MQPIPDAFALPLPQAPPASHATAEAKFLGKVFPRDAGEENKHDAVEDGTVVKPGPAPLGRGLASRYQRFEFLPELLADQGSFHACTDISVLSKFPVLLAALRYYLHSQCYIILVPQSAYKFG